MSYIYLVICSCSHHIFRELYFRHNDILDLSKGKSELMRQAQWPRLGERGTQINNSEEMVIVFFFFPSPKFHEIMIGNNRRFRLTYGVRVE